MPEYLSPGVYVEEIDTGPKPIAAVATSTAGADVGPADTTLTLSHLFGVNAGTQLTLVAATGSQIGQVTVQSVDRTTREVTLNAAAGVSAKRHDLAVITAVNNALAVLTATAS